MTLLQKNRTITLSSGPEDTHTHTHTHTHWPASPEPAALGRHFWTTGWSDWTTDPSVWHNDESESLKDNAEAHLWMPRKEGTRREERRQVSRGRGGRTQHSQHTSITDTNVHHHHHHHRHCCCHKPAERMNHWLHHRCYKVENVDLLFCCV